jgi:hypothetical protein
MATERKIESKTKVQLMNQTHNGRMERYIGLKHSEFIRAILPKKMEKDPGSEWPHSLQGVNDQKWVLEYAKEIERGH